MRRIVIALPLAVTLSVAAPVSASAPKLRQVPNALVSAAPARASVEVDASALEDGSEEIERRISEQGKSLALEAEILPARDDADPLIAVRVKDSGDPETPGFVATLAISSDGELWPGSEAEIFCELCTEGELVDKVAEAIEGALKSVAQRAEQASEAPSEAVEGPEPPPDEPPVEPPPPQKRIGGLGIAGIGVGVLGVAGVAVGAALLPRGVEPIDRGVEERDFVTPGAVSLGLGGALLVGGVVMIVLDQVRLKKQRAK